MQCDMCGSLGKLYKAIVEGAELNVCHDCSKFGKVIGVIKQEEAKEIKRKITTNEKKEPEAEKMEVIVNGYAEKIKKKREHLGLKQEEFAKKINEKESLIQKIESSHFEPSIDLAKKIENFLRIKLIEEYEEKHEKQAKSKTESFTIGDFVKIKEK